MVEATSTPYWRQTASSTCADPTMEAVWLIEGEGTLTDLDHGVGYELAPGSMYLLDGHERHRLEVQVSSGQLGWIEGGEWTKESPDGVVLRAGVEQTEGRK